MYLREMEDTIGLCISARDHIEPQLPHEEHEVGHADWATCRTHKRAHTHQKRCERPIESVAKTSSNSLFTIFDPVGVLGPVGYLSETIKEVV